MQLQKVDLVATAGVAGDLVRMLVSRYGLMIVCGLIEGDQSVDCLFNDLGRQSPLMSQRLSILRRQRIVEARRQGQSGAYRLTGDVARAIAETPARHFCVARTAAVAN